MQGLIIHPNSSIMIASQRERQHMEQKGILHYIRICQLKRLLYPLVLLVLTGLILFNLPLVEYLHVEQAAPDKPLSGAISNSRAYVRTAASDLYYTGNDYYLDGVLTGHYYYQLTDDYCRFYILRPTAGKPAETYLESRVITGRVVKFDDTTEALVREFAEELEWSTEGLMSISDPYLVNEVVYFPISQGILFVIALILALFSLVGLIYTLILLICPKLSRTYLRLKNYGSASKILQDADAELSSRRLLEEGNTILTPKYLVEFSPDASAVIPLESVLWIFKTSRMKYVLKDRRERMFFTLRIVTIAGDTFIIRDKKKADIDQIENVLTERYPNFFYGYSDEHDKMVRYILRESKRELKANKKNKKTAS